MSDSPYKRRPRLHIDNTRHQVDDVIETGRRRWIIRDIDGQKVELVAANADPGITWHTTLDNLPAPKKETHR